MKNRIFLFDLYSVLHTIKFSLGKQRLSDTEKSTFVIHGFLLKLNYLLRKTGAKTVVYALESNRSLRKEKYSLYKEYTHKKTEQQKALDKLAFSQFQEIIEYVLPTIGYQNLFSADGYEADDVIGRICKSYKDNQIVICSTDHDMYQLLTDNTAIFNPKKNIWYTKTKFKNEYGLEPRMWKRVKAIGGCSSDNIKGVPIPQSDPSKKQQHVAEKGALNFLLGKMNPKTKAYKAIISREGKKVINRNKELVILPMKGTPEFEIKPDILSEAGLKEVCEKYGFTTIMDDLNTWRHILGLRRSRQSCLIRQRV